MKGLIILNLLTQSEWLDCL